MQTWMAQISLDSLSRAVYICLNFTVSINFQSVQIKLTHCRLNELPHTIYWKILISILGMSGHVI